MELEGAPEVPGGVVLTLLLSLACAAEPIAAAPSAAAPSAAEPSAAEPSAAEPLAAEPLPVEEPAAESPCPSTVDLLPPDPQLDLADPRLQGSALIVVLKERRRTALYRQGELQGCWRSGLAYRYVAGDKRRRGDLRTPEGWYRTSDKPWSQFYGAIAVHYPGREDAAAGLAAGTIDQATHDRVVAAVERGAKPPQDTRMGGEILLHGGGGSSDWTLGCVALDDAELDALRAQLPTGMRTDLLILP